MKTKFIFLFCVGFYMILNTVFGYYSFRELIQSTDAVIFKSRFMVTEKQYKEALQIIEAYAQQQNEKAGENLAPHEIGCRVKLSKHGRELAKELNWKKPDREGIVVDWLQWFSPTDGLVTVKWEGISKADTLHVCNVEPIKKEK